MECLEEDEEGEDGFSQETTGTNDNQGIARE